MMDCPRNRSKANDIEESEPIVYLPGHLPIPIAMNTPQWKVT